MGALYLFVVIKNSHFLSNGNCGVDSLHFLRISLFDTFLTINIITFLSSITILHYLNIYWIGIIYFCK